MVSKVCKVLVLAVFCICLCMTTYARELSNKEMDAITGACKDCTSTGDNTEICEKKNPCADCKDIEGTWVEGHWEGEQWIEGYWIYNTPPGCPLDSDTADYYPGATVKECQQQVAPPIPSTGYCHFNCGTEHNCYRKYNCTSEAVVQDVMCEEGANPQCTVDTEGAQCRRCKLGTPVAGLDWYTATDDECKATPP